MTAVVEGDRAIASLVSVLTQPGDTQLTKWLEAKPWIRSTGSPAPRSTKASSKPAWVKVVVMSTGGGRLASRSQRL